MKIPLIRKRHRKYPVLRDQSGRSARQHAFELFDRGLRPAQVARELDIKPRTANRYFYDWKKLGRKFNDRYRLAQKMCKPPDLSEKTIELLGKELGVSRHEVIERLQKPWGVRDLILGKWPDYKVEKARNKAEARLKAALILVSLMEHSKESPEESVANLVALITKIRGKRSPGNP